MADRLVKAGRLSQREDVFHLSWWDFVSLLRGEWNGAGARALVADRKALAAGWLATEPPKFFVLDAEGKPTALPPEFQEIAQSSSATPGASEAASLVGIAAASGQATGACRVVRHPEDGRSLRSGEILVARSTDPSWTPLFLRAAGVATEIGGYLSHAAIVAREYGLPAVLNIPGLLDAVHDGQQLTVDGDAGRVICNLQDRTMEKSTEAVGIGGRP